MTVDNQNLITGDFEWAKLYGTNAYDNGTGFSIDRDGNIFITGSSAGNLNGKINNGQSDAFIMKLDSNGNELWTKLFGSDDDDEGYSINVLKDGSIYLIGETRGDLNGQKNNGDNDAFVMKLDSNGNEVWTKLFGTELSDIAWYGTVDENIYLWGETHGNLNGQVNNSLENEDAFLIKLDLNGNEIWTTLIGTKLNEEAFDIAVANDDSVYLVGETQDSNNSSWTDNILVSKIDQQGNLIWEKSFGEVYKNDWANSINISAEGNLYVSGITRSNLNGQTNNGGSDSFLMKLDKDGNEIWTKLYGTEKNEFAHQSSFRTDGHIFLTGGILTLDYSDEDGFLKKLDMDGNEIWTKFYGDAYIEQYGGIYVEKEGSSIYVSGHTKGDLADKKSNGDYDAILMKFSDPISFSEKLALNYICSNPDLINAFGIDIEAAKSHYENHGKSEGRSLTSFSVSDYLAKYSDLSAAFGNNETLAFKHYIQHGYSEGRTDSPTGSGSAGSSNLTDLEALNYIASYGDLINAFGSDTSAATKHYVNHGYSEGRSVDTFDEWSYLASYTDLINAFGSDTSAATKHFINHGYAEGRSADNFDELSYIAGYGDLINAFKNHTSSATQHYVNHGYAEGRSKDNFDEWGYIASNTDLIRAFGSDTSSAVKHYINHGYSERRSFDTFNASNYLSLYSDLQSAFGSDLNAATKHYVENGFTEGRVF